MGAAGALTAARQIKTSWWGAERRSEGANGSGGQRLGLPSSVIICMLVPLFFSWLSETSGSSLPGLANGRWGQREGGGGEGGVGGGGGGGERRCGYSNSLRGGGQALLCCASWKSLLLEFGTGPRCWWSSGVCAQGGQRCQCCTATTPTKVSQHERNTAISLV